MTGEAQHARRQGCHQNGKGVSVRDLQIHFDRIDIAAEVYPPFTDQRPQNRQVLFHVLRGAVVRQAHHPFDQRAVRQADSQGKTAIAGPLGGQGVLGHAQRVERIGGNHRCSEFDAACLLANDRQGRQRVITKCQQMRDPEVAEAVRLSLFHLVCQYLQVVYLTSGASKNPNAHSLSFMVS